MKAKAQRQEFLFILPLSNRKKDTDQSSALYSVKAFECVHANVVDIWVFFLSRQLIENIAYWVWFFSPLKRPFIQWKGEIFDLENWNFSIKIFSKKENRSQKEKKVRLQANLEFRQNDIKRLNKKHNIEMFSSCVRGEKAYTVKEKI